MNILLCTLLREPVGPDIGLGYLASVLRKNGDKVKVIDLKAVEIEPDDLCYIIKIYNIELVGFKILTPSLNLLKPYIKEVKKKNPKCTIVAGGPHPSGTGKEVLNKLKHLDYAFIGEAELGLPLLVNFINSNKTKNQITLNNIPGLVFRKNGIIESVPAKYIKNLDSLGFPAWDLLNVPYFLDLKIRFLRTKSYIPFITTRGCPYTCSFCAAHTISGKRIRRHSLKYIIDHLKFLKKQYKVTHFSIADDFFTSDLNFVKKVCKAMINAKLNLKWDCASNGIRVDKLDPELISLMEHAGCEHVSLGIESGSDRILELINKGICQDDVKNAIKIIRENSDILIEGFIILGFPQETIKDLMKTFMSIIKLDLDWVEPGIFSPLPGTDILKECSNIEELKNLTPESYNFWEVALTPGKLSKRLLKSIVIIYYIYLISKPATVKRFLNETCKYHPGSFLKWSSANFVNLIMS